MSGHNQNRQDRSCDCKVCESIRKFRPGMTEHKHNLIHYWTTVSRTEATGKFPGDVWICWGCKGLFQKNTKIEAVEPSSDYADDIAEGNAMLARMGRA